MYYTSNDIAKNSVVKLVKLVRLNSWHTLPNMCVGTLTFDFQFNPGGLQWFDNLKANSKESQINQFNHAGFLII